MANWTQDRNCFIIRYSVDPAKREQFEGALKELLAFAEPYADRGCRFAFHGWARDPNQWVAIAAWDPEVFQELGAAPETQRITGLMHACTTEPVSIEFFAGMKMDRSIFDQFPEQPAALQPAPSPN